MGNGILGKNDALNEAMEDGLKTAFATELKEHLMEVAEKEVDIIVERLSTRVKLNIKKYLLPSDDNRYIKLDWLLRKEGETEDDNS